MQAEFNGDHSSRFIIGYIPSFSNKKSSASQTKKSGTQGGFGCAVRDYHKCLSIILQPIVDAQNDPPLLDVLLGDQISRVRAIILMGPVLGDGKSNDMLCGRVQSFTETLRIHRGVLTPSVQASETDLPFHWIKSRVIEQVTRAAMFDPSNKERSPWNRHLHYLPTLQKKRQYLSAAKRRVRISTEILKKALGSHRVCNAFFSLDFASEYGIYGHTLADVMHLLEEGLLKYLLSVFLDPLSATVKGELDELVNKLLGAKANRCLGSRLFPRVNFTRGFSRLTLLSSEERTGALLALILVLLTDKGRELLGERFSVGFDERRKERAARFMGKRKRQEGGDNDTLDEESEAEVAGAEGATNEDDVPLAFLKRKKKFVPSRKNIDYVCSQIASHDLGFLLDDVFPEIPERHTYECLKIIWEMTYRLRDDAPDTTKLPKDALNIKAFRKRTTSLLGHGSSRPYSKTRLIRDFLNQDPTVTITDDVVHTQPTITIDTDEFLECCQNILSLRSFYNYSGEHCHDAIPLNNDGSLDVDQVQKRTREVGESLKGAVNRGEGTNGWKIPKFIDMLLLPEYMNHLGSTGKFHVGFAERGLKKWAKFPASTAQKRGDGIFEGQVSNRMHEASMMAHALMQMNSDDEESGGIDDEDDPNSEPDVGGACFYIAIDRDEDHHQRKKLSCTRLNSRKKPHSLQISLPQPILNYFKRLGRFNTIFEYRTEAVIQGTRYRAHPNYQGQGPWYDFAMVEFEHPPPDPELYVDDNNLYPAKLLGFYRLVTNRPIIGDSLEDNDFSVLAHCGGYQHLNSEIYNRRSILVRPWLYEVSGGNNPRPDYQVAGTVKTHVNVKYHIFAVEETPGFQERYSDDESRRFLVLSDMRTEWPRVFMSGSRTDG
jgi:hypothetical protein